MLMHWRKLYHILQLNLFYHFSQIIKTHFFLFQACYREGAYNLIFIKSFHDVTDEADDFINVDRNKRNILEALISCLEQPLCNMLQEWLHLFKEDSDIIADIDAVWKMRLNHDDETDIPEVPEDLQEYLSG